MMVSTVLVLAVGNESRGDDALAPLLVRKLQAQVMPQVDFIEDFQLQVEHVTDLVGRRVVLFIDADVSCDGPFQFSRVIAAHDPSYTSHAMSPAAVLHTYRQVYGCEAPESHVLRIRGHGFELGEGLSEEATANLDQATRMISAWLADIRVAE